MQKEIISQSFTIHFANGDEKHFPKTDTSEYRWSLTPSGDMLVYYVEKHGVISNAIIKDERVFAWAAGVWSAVVVDQDDED